MNKKNISRKEFNYLFDFIACYFADYWEGRTEANIVDEAVSGEAREFLEIVLDQINKFIEMEAPLENKRDFIEGAGIYDETGKDTIRRLERIKSLIQQKISTQSEL